MIVSAEVLIHIKNDHVNRACVLPEDTEFLKSRHQAIETNRGADAGYDLLCVEGGEVIISASRAYSADFLSSIEVCFIYYTGVIIQPPGYRGINNEPVFYPAGFHHFIEMLQSLDMLIILSDHISQCRQRTFEITAAFNEGKY